MTDTCSSCGLRRAVLVALNSPQGEYLLCRGCLGRDGEKRAPRVPTEIPPRKRSA
jgi:hypothetical protein